MYMYIYEYTFVHCSTMLHVHDINWNTLVHACTCTLCTPIVICTYYHIVGNFHLCQCTFLCVYMYVCIQTCMCTCTYTHLMLGILCIQLMSCNYCVFCVCVCVCVCTCTCICMCTSCIYTHNMLVSPDKCCVTTCSTVFARSDAAATIYFIA